MEWYKWYPALYEADTEHLTAEQDGIYRRLIDRYMRTRQPLPDNDNALARIAGVSLDSWCHASAIVKPFFRSNNGKLFHKFCDKQLAEQDETTKTKSVIGRIGAEKRWKKNEENQQADGSSHASAIAAPMQEEKRGDRDKKKVNIHTTEFETFWSLYPHKVGKTAALTAYKSAIKKGTTHEQLINGASQFAAAHAAAGTEKRFIPHPTTWLNQGRWEDDLGGIGQRSSAGGSASNARGSQFGAVKSALAELLQEDPSGMDQEPPRIPEWGDHPPLGLPATGGQQSRGIPLPADRVDASSGQTIDHDPAESAHG